MVETSVEKATERNVGGAPKDGVGMERPGVRFGCHEL